MDTVEELTHTVWVLFAVHATLSVAGLIMVGSKRIDLRNVGIQKGEGVLWLLSAIILLCCICPLNVKLYKLIQQQCRNEPFPPPIHKIQYTFLTILFLHVLLSLGYVCIFFFLLTEIEPEKLYGPVLWGYGISVFGITSLMALYGVLIRQLRQFTDRLRCNRPGPLIPVSEKIRFYVQIILILCLCAGGYTIYLYGSRLSEHRVAFLAWVTLVSVLYIVFRYTTDMKILVKARPGARRRYTISYACRKTLGVLLGVVFLYLIMSRSGSDSTRSSGNDDVDHHLVIGVGEEQGKKMSHNT